MSQQYDNELRGALFKNDRRERETQPEYTGSIQINGQEFWLSAWIKEGRSGKFMSLSATPKDQPKGQRNQQKQAPAGDFEDLNSDVPF